MSYASSPYQVNIKHPALIANAWVPIESLPNDFIISMATQDHTIWLGAPRGVISYNGIDIKKYDHRHGLSDKASYVVKINENNDIFALSDQQIFQLNGEKWQPFGPRFQLSRSNGSFNQRIIFANNSFWLLDRTQLLQITKNKLQTHSISTQPLNTFHIDQHGYFWFTEKNSATVLRYAQNQNGFSLLNSWPQLTGETQHARKFIEIKQQLWLLNATANKPPVVINNQQPLAITNHKVQWQEERYSITNNYVDMALTALSDGTLILANQSSINVKTQGKWQRISTESIGIHKRIYDLQTTNNDVVWLFEQNNGVRRLNTQNPRQSQYLDLLYGCENKQHQYFLEKNNSLVTYNKLSQQWRSYNTHDGIIEKPVNVLCSEHSKNILVYGSHQGQPAISYQQPSDNKEQPWQQLTFKDFGISFGPLSVYETTSGDIYAGNNDLISTNQKYLYKLTNSRLGYQVSKLSIPEQRVSVISEVVPNHLILSSYDLTEIKKGRAGKLALPDNLLTHWIEDIKSDEYGNLWLATWDYGVLRYYNQRWHQFSTIEGLSDERVSSILPIKANNILALTSQGVDRFDGNTWQATDIGHVESIREGSSLAQSSDGSIWVNQTSRNWMFRVQPGINKKGGIFYTIKYQPSALSPRIQANIETPPEKYGTAIYLNWRAQDQWSETPSKKIKYSYRINQSAWSPFSSDTNKYLSNLAPNDYSFEVRARDGDGNISAEPAHLNFKIITPFWQQTWFYLLIAGTCLLILCLTALLYFQRLKQASRINDARMQFLTNISHELRNPLALVITPLEDIINKTALPQQNNGIYLALKSAKRLKQLIDQLLEYRRLQAGHITLNKKNGDLILFIKFIVNDLAYLAQSKKQQIHFSSNLAHYTCDFDHDVLRKIIDNLIGNALKYSDIGDEVFVRCEINEDLAKVNLAIEDQGIGIDTGAQKHIFNMFYTQKNNQFGNVNSFGIGLAFVKNLVELCQATIQLQSPPPNKTQGSVFNLTFTNMCATLAPSIDINQNTLPLAPTTLNTPSNGAQQATKENNDAIHLLIVDDNIELAQYLASELSNDFNIHTEYNGESALAYAKKEIPDVIISDLKMPKMNGLVLCEHLKQATETSHIPVLLHSAMVSETHQLQGLAIGAVDYLTKPVSTQVIRTRINNLMANRHRYADFLKRNISLIPSPEELHAKSLKNEQVTIAELNMDKNETKFLDHIKNNLQQHFHEPDFNAEKLASLMFMSRSAFYRKFKALTNITPADYIKSHRLTVAANLLKQKQSIADIAIQVGYSDASSFNRAFKSYFGVVPSEQRE